MGVYPCTPCIGLLSERDAAPSPAPPLPRLQTFGTSTATTPLCTAPASSMMSRRGEGGPCQAAAQPNVQPPESAVRSLARLPIFRLPPACPPARPMLQGRDGIGAAPCCGTGVVFRRDVLVSIGGQVGAPASASGLPCLVLSAAHRLPAGRAPPLLARHRCPCRYSSRPISQPRGSPALAGCGADCPAPCPPPSPQSYGSITEDYNTAMALMSAGFATMCGGRAHGASRRRCRRRCPSCSCCCCCCCRRRRCSPPCERRARGRGLPRLPARDASTACRGRCPSVEAS